MTRNLEAVRDPRVSDKDLGAVRKAHEASAMAIVEADLSRAKADQKAAELRLMIAKLVNGQGQVIKANQICLICGIVYPNNAQACPGCP